MTEDKTNETREQETAQLPDPDANDTRKTTVSEATTEAATQVRDALGELKNNFESIDFDNDLMDQIAARPLKRQTWREALYLMSTIPAAFVALLIWTVGGPLSVPLIFSIIGIPLLIAMFWLFRKYAGVERRRVNIVDPEPVIAVYDQPEGNLIEKGIGFISDSQTWKDMGWMVVLSIVGFPVAVLALGTWLIAFSWLVYPTWGWAVSGDATPIGFLLGDDVNFFESFLMIPFGVAMVVVATWICAGVSYALVAISKLLLGSNDEAKLRGRVTELERTREQSLSQQSTEMSRIERDLHDGAQARLVALAMDLGMAEEKIKDDPEAAQKLVSEARDEAQRTLQELRDLVRGIGPQILRDRGLEAALTPLAARSPIKVDLDVQISSRPGERSESTAYFVCSEALANAIKHSEAERIRINIWSHEDWLYTRVSDNGVGGASIKDGHGLQGLRARVEAVDGKLIVDSSAGGPTIIDAWLPFGSR